MRSVHSHSPGLRENISMDVHHQVASSCVLHDKTHVLLRLETRKQVDQERVADAVDRLKNPLLTHQTVKGKRAASDLCSSTYRYRGHIKIYSKKTKKNICVYLSTSSRATMSPFFSALMANISPVLLYSANNTWGEKRHFSFLPAPF